MFERVISGLNTRLNDQLSLSEGEEVFLIEEDRDWWLIFATENERKEVSEFIEKVFSREARFSIGCYPFEKLFEKWYVHSRSGNFSELKIVVSPFSRMGMEITEVTRRYFEEMGFEVGTTVKEDE